MTKISNPKFSIAIPAYNRGDYLRQTLKSCLAQTVQDFEVVISDNCSTENLQAIAESLHDPRIRYFRSDVPLVVAKNHERAVSLTVCEYVVCLHSDDLLLPNYLEEAGDALDHRIEAAAVYSSIAILTGSKMNGCRPIPELARFV